MINCNTKIERIKEQDLTKSLLQIKDTNITLKNTHRIEKIEGQKYFIFSGTLTYTPKKYGCCGCDNINNIIVKNSFNELTRVYLLKISGLLL